MIARPSSYDNAHRETCHRHCCSTTRESKSQDRFQQVSCGVSANRNFLMPHSFLVSRDIRRSCSLCHNDTNNGSNLGRGGRQYGESCCSWGGGQEPFGND
jgi:hypothetical protein